MKCIPDETATTELETVALEWLNSQGENYPDDGAEGAFNDLMQGGCQSGIVGDLIYYTDTTAFYQTHVTDIGNLVQEMIEGTGLPIHELFGDKWDASDPLASGDLNQNLLAWFGFEEAARAVREGQVLKTN